MCLVENSPSKGMKNTEFWPGEANKMACKAMSKLPKQQNNLKQQSSGLGNKTHLCFF